MDTDSAPDPIDQRAQVKAEVDADVEGTTALPPKVESWRRRSAAGAILTGFALGLQQALEAPKEEQSIVMETSGDPPKDLPVEAEFEYGRPRQSVVNIRPWLIADSATPDNATPDAATQDAALPDSAHPASADRAGTHPDDASTEEER